MHKVYIKLNENNEILDVASDVFLEDPTEWIEIDEGFGDRYVHAQGNYLPGTITDENGNPRYMYEEGKISEIT